MGERILILGGGFAGVIDRPGTVEAAAAGAPARAARASTADGASRSPLNRDNYFVFQPLLADIISGTIETTHVVVPLRRMLQGVQVEVGLIDAIDPIARDDHACAAGRAATSFTVAYDALIVALGSVTDFSARCPGMAEHAIGVRTLGDAFYLRNRALDDARGGARSSPTRLGASGC